MIKKIVFTILVLVFAVNSVFATEMIFYKYSEGNGNYSVLVAKATEKIKSRSAREAIANRLISLSFSLNDVSRDYYKIDVIPNIHFFGYLINQYDISPHANDRFRHVVWADNLSGKLIKTEVYDNNNELLFAYSNVDFNKISSKPDKYMNMPNNHTFYKGFSHVATKVLPEGLVHMAFTDGLNRISVFATNKITEPNLVKNIVYGNYLLSKVLNGTEYTVVGSIPYEMMEEFITTIDENKKEINKKIKAGLPLTSDILAVE